MYTNPNSPVMSACAEVHSRTCQQDCMPICCLISRSALGGRAVDLDGAKSGSAACCVLRTERGDDAPSRPIDTC